MHDVVTVTSVDETDLALLHALMVHPRLAWRDVGDVLGVSASTCARRWRRLSDDGIAWTSVSPGGKAARGRFAGAAVLVRCEAGATATVSSALLDHPGVLAVEHVTGEHDLFCEVVARSHAGLGELVEDVVRRLPGVVATRTEPVARLYKEGSQWRLDALDADQQRAVAELLPDPIDTGLVGADDTSVVLALADDPRMTVEELGDRLGVSARTAGRQLHRAMAAGDIALRCDVAQDAVGFPVTLNAWYAVPADTVAACAAELSALPTTRMCASVLASDANLYAAYWLRSYADAAAVEAEVLRRMPGARPVRRAVALRVVKRSGRVFDADGRAVRRVEPHYD